MIRHATEMIDLWNIDRLKSVESPLYLEARAMVTPRANWKGFIKFGEVVCPVALYTAASSAERISFHILNRKTGNRVRREFVDSETGDPVERDAQVKGYELDNGRYVVLEPEEVTAVVPDSDKTLKVDAFVACNDIDNVYFDKPYYLAPGEAGIDAFVLLRDGMKKAKVAAIARTVLFRRLRTVLLRPHGKGLIATTLNFDYEVRSSEKAFERLPNLKIEKEMLDLAEHIIDTKKGTFDPGVLDDRYETALAELVKAKIEGRKLPKRKPPVASKPNDLLAALRESAKSTADGGKKKRTAANTNPSRRKTDQPATSKQKSGKAAPKRNAG